MDSEQVGTFLDEELLSYARTHGVPCMSSATEERIIQHLMIWKPGRILEIGSAVGYSTSRFARTCAARDGQVLSFEVSHPSYMVALQHIWNTHLHNILIYHQDILKTPLHTLCEKNSIDVVFIDGAKQEYSNYIEHILPYCHAGTKIICDDVLMYAKKVHSLYHTLEAHHLSYEIIKLDVDDGILLITLM